MSVATRLKDITVYDPEGAPVRLGDLWRERPVVLTFVRHFGCLFCREQVAALRAALPEIHARGAELVIVGNGRPEHAADFRESEGITTPLLVDPELRAYRAAGLRRGLASSLGPRVALHALRALLAGGRQTAVKGDPWQQGGVFVIRPDDSVAFAHVSREAGDHPEVADVLAALGSRRVRRRA